MNLRAEVADMSGLVSVVHVVGGTIVLAAAPAALLVRKGGAWHRRAGQIFTGCMIAVMVTAAFMWQSHGHGFLLFLDGVSAYLLFSGYRAVARRRRRARKERSVRADILDLGAAIGSFGLAAFIIGIALFDPSPLMRTLAYILAALAAVAASFAALDIKSMLTRVPMRIGWLLTHLSAMIAVYISAVTAFVVINAHSVPMELRWIVPSVLGSTLIAIYSIRYRRAAARGRQAHRAG